MQKIVLTTMIAFVSVISMGQQKAQKPKVMVVPEEAFCINAEMSASFNPSK